MERYAGYIFDLDGTLYRGSEPIHHAVEVVRELESAGSWIGYLTNNSSVHRDRLAAKLQGMGFPCHPDQVVSSATGAAEHLPRGARCHVLGSDDLRQTLQEAGAVMVTEGATHVVAGICRDLTYPMLDAALQNFLGGAKFIATNTDATYPIEAGRQQPGAGTTIGALTVLAGRSPDFEVGKPNPFLVRLFLDAWDLEPEDVLVVGDRFETDILAGQNAGCPTHLILTGVTTEPIDGLSCSRDLRGLL